VRIALVAREVYPLDGGGIGQYVACTARVLSTLGEVTIVTTSRSEPEYRRLQERGDPRLPDSVDFAFVPEPTPDVAAAWSHLMHSYSARVVEVLKELYGSRGPDLLEFPDFGGEGFVALQAAEALDPFFTDTTICVRLHTTAEIVEVLDGCSMGDRWSRALHAMERYSLAHADHVLWAGGDVLGTYQRFYGADALGSPVRVRHPYGEPLAPEGADRSYEPGSPLRLLYAGRLERRKGVAGLVDAITGSERDDIRLTLVGADTDTAPLGQSMRELLTLAMAGDQRITLRDPVQRAELGALIRAHDLVVIPSRWECWPYAALEALYLNRPVLATPVGGLCEIVADPNSGRLTRGRRIEDLQDAIESLLLHPEELGTMIRCEGPRARARELTADSEVVRGYREILGAERSRRALAARPAGQPVPLVSAVVPYYRTADHVRETVASLLAQTYPRLEIVIVNDGSFDATDVVLADLDRAPVRIVTQVNKGLGAARNFGVLQSLGRYVFPLDADNCAEPEFVARCVEILERRPDVAYVTAWTRYVEPDGRPRLDVDLGFEPLGDHASLNRHVNVAGDAAAVIRRRVFDAGHCYNEELTSYEDWHFYQELARAQLGGVVIPERLIRYRVRGDSMQARVGRPRHERLVGEIDARLRENQMRWESSSG
jgi:glycosyltransferase involved in cell wall biosynthesis